mmetsp:Transcript_12376/g.28238  ORF Transcript_12376/g.28238 Transcript_12376/m.28238 type:complete len:356 (-) Transcript_12376:463-1530(-)
MARKPLVPTRAASALHAWKAWMGRFMTPAILLARRDHFCISSGVMFDIMPCICFIWSSETSRPIAFVIEAIAAGSMFFIMSSPAFIMSGFMFSIISMPLSIDMLAKSGIPPPPADKLASPPADELEPAPAPPMPGMPPIPGIPPPICCAILAILFIASGSIFFIICETILSCSGATPPSCGAMALSCAGSIFSSISACCFICSGVILSSISSIAAPVGMPGGMVGAAAAFGAAGAAGLATLVGFTPSVASTSVSAAATMVSLGSISIAFFRSSRASLSWFILWYACPRRKYALRFAPRSRTVDACPTAALKLSSFSWQLALLRWHASLRSTTACLSAPLRSPSVSISSTAAAPSV